MIVFRQLYFTINLEEIFYFGNKKRIYAAFGVSQTPKKYRIGREMAPMTAADIILIFIGGIGLLIAFGSFVIALLAFQGPQAKKIMPTLLAPEWAPLTER